MKNALISSSYFWPFTGLNSVSLGLSCTAELRSGHTAPGVSPVLSGEGESPSLNLLAVLWQFSA